MEDADSVFVAASDHSPHTQALGTHEAVEEIAYIRDNIAGISSQILATHSYWANLKSL